ncbi:MULTISPECIES: hypothetical protein [Ralstonia]|jgi:hypothetical protein|uniref:hypothetical protein n=1 Tax=Ralstonia TaxID=48736 RepID=UPI0004ADE1B5|nr:MULTISPECIES: hypothetical protein [Ralstonia]MBA9936763.1 hypothetical protein [Ralstonia insidiosa]MBX3807599.1 hypothetical protein [Ralstonia pickettii]MBX3850753.1 hypothetical protein [Ralstonia pickettii]MBX3855963.1 hypothetical protein [Ralstonia pickettii]MBX3885358.1 hypothetical protein [Ralstonia pickettii]
MVLSPENAARDFLAAARRSFDARMSKESRKQQRACLTRERQANKLSRDKSERENGAERL